MNSTGNDGDDIKKINNYPASISSSKCSCKHKIAKYRATPVTPRNKLGRNKICPCGSGKKYKKCCLLKREYIPIVR